MKKTTTYKVKTVPSKPIEALYQEITITKERLMFSDVVLFGIALAWGLAIGFQVLVLLNALLTFLLSLIGIKL